MAKLSASSHPRVTPLHWSTKIFFFTPDFRSSRTILNLCPPRPLLFTVNYGMWRIARFLCELGCAVKQTDTSNRKKKIMFTFCRMLLIIRTLNWTCEICCNHTFIERFAYFVSVIGFHSVYLSKNDGNWSLFLYSARKDYTIGTGVWDKFYISKGINGSPTFRICKLCLVPL